MNLSSVRCMFEEAGRRTRTSGREESMALESSNSLSSIPSVSTMQSDDDLQQETMRTSVKLSDEEMLERARAAHLSEDFASLAAEPLANGLWKRMKTVDRFVVSRREMTTSNTEKRDNELEILCAGRIDASLEEVASIFRSNSEDEHNTAMSALYAKSFIFGSYEREVPCSTDAMTHDDEIVVNSSEQLAVKTKSFTRTAMFANNEQWCYFDYFQRKKERDGFTISMRALPPTESTPGRIVGRNARVDQLHGLNASYLVDKLPNSKGLRVVLHAWFDPPEDSGDRPRSSSQSFSSRFSSHHQLSMSSSFRSTSMDYEDASKHKAQLRRLLALAQSLTKLPDLIRRRRFGVQIPVNLSATYATNTRCPCCTHSLAPVKMSLAMAASAIANRSLSSIKMDTRRCYLCGYLVCIGCWTAQHMESCSGRVAAIVVCVRCNVNVQACEYSEVFAGSAKEREKHRGPPRVVEDSNNVSVVSLLVDFLSTSLLNTSSGSPEHAAVVAVTRMLLESNESDLEDEDHSEYDSEDFTSDPLDDDAMNKVEMLLSDEQNVPPLEACKLANADQRDYLLDLPDDPTADVPHFPIPRNEAARITAAKTTRLLELANCIAPEIPDAGIQLRPDTRDLEVLCQLAVKTVGFSHAFISIMCAKHEHFLAEDHPVIARTVAAREHTTCQHALMSSDPFMVAHHEADVRLHNAKTTKDLNIRSYVGFPLTVPAEGAKPGDEEVTVGMFCCLDSTPHIEITRRQYSTMKRLARITTSFLLRKARQLHQPTEVHDDCSSTCSQINFN
ncbi:uncharacterized protein PITG_15469 [Phytophthora infestans T30-4]|uniref:GAF domain-containing protein n=1 Tax=Phytophthora infestans (strain T30-4) TaxID=403677 RepID=D0NRB4_PHYIT|nr:uncharacterized protein PITG_15469 [Phytophthora infestans T30-4]EEY63236.1 conserved hypothetical protein [Phytophthora infestans T30-4]|eukprot:XP_002898413.1 conserved hypothetical protein [Phytophthora infestans T30-4]